MADRYLDKRLELPSAYVEFIESCDGWEGDLGEKIGYVVIWSKETIQDRWQSYQMDEFMSDEWFPFGSDGGDEMLCFDLRRGDDSVFTLPYIGMSAEEPIPKCDSFSTISSAIAESPADE
ncbi:SMI1/KNR4 family protein [Actomonas aquatica]|uniref:SMI1/KNR4 family protein n=1 Tax=Actomonas aquatica TaxID=2866162 RepID=A0ABZ1C1R0_9BACT|nr:SMI1/KNR4 family protein [Opitutus sp. WL0086]WRQ85529.1 SMI1/KNR4 family protein [Opitutus sp. WL0086]